MPLSHDQAKSAPYFHSCEYLPGRSEALLRPAFELRYQVYCLECEFLDAEAYPEQFETDEYDSTAAHFCSYNQGEELVGYVRLIISSRTKPLPVLERCPALGQSMPPLDIGAEISRLMVREDYRRRRGDSLSGANLDDGIAYDVDRRNKSPGILLSLYRQMYQYSLNANIRYWFAAMEPSLARVLSRMSFGFRQIGPTTDYYGPVAPYVADLRDLEKEVHRRDPGLLEWMRSPTKIGL